MIRRARDPVLLVLLLLLTSVPASAQNQELTIFGPSQPGGTVTGELRGPPGEPSFLALGLGFLDPPVQLLGNPWYISPFEAWVLTALPPLPPEGELVFPMTIPMNPNLLGDFLHLQGGAGLVLTNVTTLRVHEPAPQLTTGVAGENTGLRLLGVDLDGDADDELIFTAMEGGAGAGEIHIAYGPSTSATQVLTDPTPQAGGLFGAALAAADLIGGPDVDLVVGAMGASLVAPFADSTGEVWIFEGPAFTSSVQLVSPDPQPGAAFGVSVALGDFDGNGVLDLAVGESNALVGTDPVAGRVHVFDGATLTATTTLSRPDGPPALAAFGLTVAAADFDGNGTHSLLVGAPGANVSGQPQVGVGYRYDDVTLPPQILMDSAPEAAEAFACMIVVGDVVGDGRPDIVVGSPGGAGSPQGNPDDVLRPGEVQVFDGGDPSAILVLEDPTPQQLGHFGFAVHAADVDGDGIDDLIVGANLSTLGGQANAGSAFVYMGKSLAIRVEVTADAPVANDQFGTMVGSVDSDGDGQRDLLVGAHLADPGGQVDAGVVKLVRF